MATLDTPPESLHEFLEERFVAAQQPGFNQRGQDMGLLEGQFPRLPGGAGGESQLQAAVEDKLVQELGQGSHLLLRTLRAQQHQVDI